jgi:nucleotide sugar dehydrogenase
LAELNAYGETKIVIVKSTIPPNTTSNWNKVYDNIDIVFSPEFLTEANAVSDFDNQTRIILGGSNESTSLLNPIFKNVFPNATIIETDSTSAEMVKYVTNTFLATKVAFANEIYQICNGLGLEYDEVIDYAKMDTRLGDSHWMVPGPDGNMGFGGHCFPKDLRALQTIAEQLDIIPLILTSVDEKNKQVRSNRDWEQMKGRAVL